MQKVLYLNEPRMHTLTGKPNEQMRLVPGRNIVDGELFSAIRKSSKSFKSMCEDGTILVQGETVDIDKMDVPGALKVIDMETSVEAIEELIDQENKREKPRKSLIKAAKEKMSAIMEADEEAAHAKAEATTMTPKVAAGGGDNA